MADIKVEAPKQLPPKQESKKAAPPTEKTLSQQGLKREEAILGGFQVGALLAVTFGQFADSGAISMHAENVSHQTALMAEDNEAFAAGIDSFLKVGPYAGLIGAALPMVLQLLVNHNLIPSKFIPGGQVVPPDILEAQVKTDLIKMQMEAMKAQQDAEDELNRMREEMANQNGHSNTPA